MELVDKNELSIFSKELLEEAAAMIAPGQIRIFVEDDLPFDIDARTQVTNSGDYTIALKPTALHDEYILSHELLHICSGKHIPNIIGIFQSDIVGIIGSELQGYLEHNWILAEQKRRGLEIDELKLHADVEETIGYEQEGLEQNINRILILNNLQRTFPKVFEAHKDFFEKYSPKSLELSKRIMSVYPDQEVYSYYEARRCTVRAIKEWNKIFKESSLASLNLSYLISVKPVFSEAQLKRISDVVLHVVPNVILNQENQTSDHVLITANDGQCCVMFAMGEQELLALQGFMRRVTLEEFLKAMKVEYLVR